MAKKKPAAESTPKRGKECPQCKTLVGSRTSKCKCGHVFTPKEKTNPTTKKTQVSDLHSALVAERDRLQDLLDNRESLQDRLKAINELLSKM